MYFAGNTEGVQKKGKHVKMVVEGVWIAMLQVALLVAGVDLGGVLLTVVFSVCRVVCLTQL